MEKKLKLMLREEARIYNYINRVFTTICEYYNYDFRKMPTMNGSVNDLSPLFDKLDWRFDDKLNKVYFNGTLLEDKKEQNYWGLVVKGSNKAVINADVVAFSYRFFEELGLNDIVVKINSNNMEVYEYLDYLEVIYEVDENLKLENNMGVIYKIVSYSDEKEIVLSEGKTLNDNITYIIDGDKLISELIKLDNFKGDKSVEIFVVANTKEEKLNAVRLIQDLRWSEIKADMDYLDDDVCQQLKLAEDLKARIVVILNDDDLLKGLITVKDALTGEETKIDEGEILDFILSNL